MNEIGVGGALGHLVFYESCQKKVPKIIQNLGGMKRVKSGPQLTETTIATHPSS
jgi:hypothetical protein